MSTGNRTTKPAKGAVRTWVISVGAVVILLAPFVFLIVMQLGFVHGEELSRDTLRRRRFHYYEIPFLHLQLTGITRHPNSDDLAKHLADSKIIPLRQELPANWDLVTGSRGAVVVSRGDSSILCAYLDAEDAEGKRVWLEWSEKNPALASVFWPEVLLAVQDQLYSLVPDLFSVAASAESVGPFRTTLLLTLAAKYCEHAQIQQQLGRHENAVTLFNSAIRYDPEHVDSLRGRARSLERLGESEKVAQDASALRNLNSDQSGQ